MIALLLAAIDGSAAATPPEIPLLGAHTLLGQSEGKGTNPAISAPIDTQASGSSLLVLVSSYASNDAAPTDSYGNRWMLLGRNVVYRGYERRFDARAYVAAEARGGPDHRLTIAKPGNAAGELGAPFIKIRHAGVLQAVAQNYPAPGILDRLDRAWRKATVAAPTGSTTLTSGKVTTRDQPPWWRCGGATRARSG